MIAAPPKPGSKGKSVISEDQEKSSPSFFQSKLGTKLIFSHLLATLGALIVLTIVILFATQKYFVDSQHQLIYEQAFANAQYYEGVYVHFLGGSWDNVRTLIQSTNSPSLLIVADQSATVKLSLQPRYFSLSQAERATIQQCISQALVGQQPTGNLQDPDPQYFSGYYVCLPLTVNGQLIGAIFYADPAVYPQGYSSDTFLANISTAVIITGIGIALVVALLCLFFVRSLTRPLVLMKQSVERLSAGNYAERIPDPLPEDELGHLASSFNQMAKQIEEDIHALQQQERYRRELTANIAHDLSTPLASIRGFSEALADGVIQDEQARADTYKVIIREIERLSLLVKDVQQLSSLESGQITLDCAAVDLPTLVNETIEVITPQCEEARIVIQNMLGSASISIYADGNRIIQVLLNLFDNARRYTPAGGTITVEGTVQDMQVILRLTDTGSGIAPQDLPYIFDRFYRADPSRARATGGSGLGLAIVKTIIELHHGTIRAESIVGKGTSIIVTFPVISG